MNDQEQRQRDHDEALRLWRANDEHRERKAFVDGCAHGRRDSEGYRAGLESAVDAALCDLECAELRCWCFTRAAMRNLPPCACSNCDVWRRLSTAFDAADEPDPSPEECARVVAELGIDVPKFAAELRAKVAATSAKPVRAAPEAEPPRLTPEIIEEALKRGAENAAELAEQLNPQPIGLRTKGCPGCVEKGASPSMVDHDGERLVCAVCAGSGVEPVRAAPDDAARRLLAELVDVYEAKGAEWASTVRRRIEVIARARAFLASAPPVAAPQRSASEIDRSVLDGAMTVAIGGEYTECTLGDFVHSCSVLISEQQERPNPDNAVVSALCNAVRLAREHSRMATSRLDDVGVAACAMCGAKVRRRKVPADGN